MINILHIIDTTGPGGAETVYIELADKIRSEKVHCIAIVRGDGWVRQELERRQVETIVMETKGAFNLKFLFALFLLVRKRNIHLIQSHLLGANVYSSVIGWLSRIPVVGTFHGMVDVNPEERFRWAKLWLMNRGLKASVCVSKALADYVEKNQLLNRQRNHIIYNGVDTEKYQLKKDASLRKKLEIPQDVTVLGCLGNIRPAKNYPLLIKVLAILKQENCPVHAVIAGHQKPKLMHELSDLSSRLNVTDCIHFIGHVDNPALFLSQIDVFVLCSSSEGFSISTIEAMASRLPVIATRCGGPEEILTDKQDGMLVENDNQKEMAQSIRELIVNPMAADEFADKAVKTANSRFSLSNMILAYRNLYTTYLPKISDK